MRHTKHEPMTIAIARHGELRPRSRRAMGKFLLTRLSTIGWYPCRGQRSGRCDGARMHPNRSRIRLRTGGPAQFLQSGPRAA